MRISGNGVIFTAIAAAGVILLTVAARMSSLAVELERVQQDQRSVAHGDLPPHEAGPLLLYGSTAQEKQSLRRRGRQEQIKTPEIVSKVFRSSSSPAPPMNTTIIGSESTPQSTLTTSVTTTSSRIAMRTLPLEIKNESWPFAGILYNPQTPCRVKPKAVAAIFTLPKEKKVREWVRENIRNMTDGAIMPVFPLGRPPLHRGINDEDEGDDSSLKLGQDLLNEAYDKEDVIIGDFVDSYEDLARKSILVFDWFAKSCTDQVRWLVKVDVDVVVNWKYLVDGLEKFEKDGAKQDIKSDNTPLKPPKKLRADKDPIWVGHRWIGMPVIHDKKHKNYEDIALDEFPPYCSGPSYLMNNITVTKIIETRTKDTRYYRNEDAMLGLLLYDKAVPINDERFIVFIGSDWRYATCGKRTSTISECDCDKWWTYHCGSHRGERDTAIKYAYQCANKPLLDDKVDIPQLR